MKKYKIWYITKEGVKDFEYAKGTTYEQAYKEFMCPWMKRNISSILAVEELETAV